MNKKSLIILIVIALFLIIFGFAFLYFSKENQNHSNTSNTLKSKSLAPQYKEQIIQNLDLFKKYFRNENYDDITKVFQNLTEEEFKSALSYKEDIKYSVNNLKVGSVLINDSESNFSLAIINIQQNGCDKNTLIQISKNTEGKFLFTNIEDIIKNTCTYSEILSQNKNIEIELVCSDCTFAPVDKVHKLSENYIPHVVPIQVKGEGLVTPDTKEALLKLFTDAKKKNIYPYLTSSYRSYSLQEGVYKRTIQRELDHGYTQVEAEQRAELHSAKPGSSEHQLGTTVDISCDICEGLTGPKGNKILHKYIEANAHRFGFIISYPPNSEASTGYQHEPWHIRYIGIDFATELYNRGYINSNGEIYLAKYLREKSLY